jgi:hypothetical protein
MIVGVKFCESFFFFRFSKSNGRKTEEHCHSTQLNSEPQTHLVTPCPPHFLDVLQRVRQQQLVGGRGSAAAAANASAVVGEEAAAAT